MNDLTPGQVEQQLVELGRALDANAEVLADLDAAYVRAKHDYDLAYARAILSADGKTADERKAKAALVTDAEKFAAEVAEAKVRAAREKQRTLALRVDIGRSLGAGIRAALSA